MITPYLEQLIWEGKAITRSWAIGGGGVSRIPVTKNTFIIIYGITFHPFLDESRNGPTLQDFQEETRRSNIHSLLLYSSKYKWMHNFRTWLSAVTSAADSMTFGMPGVPLHIPCYILFDENVRVNVQRVNSAPEGWLNPDFNTMPGTSDELASSQGYGFQGSATPQNTLRSWNFPLAGDSAVYPNADQVPLQAANAADATYQFETKGGNGTLFNPTTFPAIDQNGMNFPLINFDYVEIFGAIPPQIKKG